MSSKLILQRNFHKRNSGASVDSLSDSEPYYSVMMDTEMMDEGENKVGKIGTPYLDRLKRETEHENIDEKTPDALKVAARRKLEVDRQRKEKLKQTVREISEAPPLLPLPLHLVSDTSSDVVYTMSRVTLNESAGGILRMKRRSSETLLKSEDFKRLKFNSY